MKNLAILGGGESGIGAALLGLKIGWKVFLSDNGRINEQYRSELIKHNVRFEENGHTIEILEKADLVVKSPGIPGNVAIVKSLEKQGKRIISELEFAFMHYSGKIIGITGSNGKTTTSLLAYHLLKKAGKSVALAGNIGNSFSRELCEQEEKEYYVIEISSFQLDDIIDFHCDVAILLNITADHLDRYEYKMENYAASKMRIIKNQSEKDVFIYNSEDEIIQAEIERLECKQKLIKIRPSSTGKNLLLTNKGLKIEIQNTVLQGKHNVFNASCAVEMALELGVDIQTIRHSLTSFRNHPHRMERVCNLNGVLYINDSKATNTDSVRFALDAIDPPVIWIAGGVDKGNDYRILRDLVSEKCKLLICLGLDNGKLLTTFSEVIPLIEEAKSMKEAIRLAKTYAEKGDCVLMSPACASFDLFENYKDRGNQFKREIFNLLRIQEK